MYKKRNVLAWLVITVSMSVAALSPALRAEDVSRKEMNKKVEAAADAIKNYTITQKDEAVKSAKASLEDLDARIKYMEDRLDKEWNHMDNAARDASRASLRKLREQRTELADWYGQLKQSSATAWDVVKRGFFDSYEVLRGSLDKAQKEF